MTPVTGPKACSDRRSYYSPQAARASSARLFLALIGSNDDLRDDVGFLGSLPLPQRTESKPVTPKGGVAADHPLPGGAHKFTGRSDSRHPRSFGHRRATWFPLLSAYAT